MNWFDSAFYAGMSLGLSLIIVIGAQNALVLKQGLKCQHVFMVCLICAFSDAVLIACGVFGFYLLIAKFTWLETVARYGGALFLMGYGVRSFYTSFTSSEYLQTEEGSQHSSRGSSSSRGIAAATCLAITWLNPHVYLDTVVLLGSVSASYAELQDKLAFASGAMLASFAFFFALGYGARGLTPLFRNPLSWKIVDFAIGIIMWGIAISLLIGVL